MPKSWFDWPKVVNLIFLWWWEINFNSAAIGSWGLIAKEVIWKFRTSFGQHNSKVGQRNGEGQHNGRWVPSDRKNKCRFLSDYSATLLVWGKNSWNAFISNAKWKKTQFFVFYSFAFFSNHPVLIHAHILFFKVYIYICSCVHVYMCVCVFIICRFHFIIAVSYFSTV